MPSLSMTRPCSSRWNSRKSPESSAPPPLKGASRPVAVRVKVSAVRVGRARRPRMPPPPPSRRETAAACGEGAALATAAERDIERRNEAAVAARVGGRRTGTMCRARTVRALVLWTSPVANRRAPRKSKKEKEENSSAVQVLPPARKFAARCRLLEKTRAAISGFDVDHEKRPDSRTRGSDARVREDRLGDRARARSRAQPPSRSRSFVAHRALPVEPIEVFPPASTAKEGAEIYGIMARPMTVALTEDERKKFDDIGLDDINAMTDVNQLNKLAKYMECVFSPTRPSGSRAGSLRTIIDPRYGWTRRRRSSTRRETRASPLLPRRTPFRNPPSRDETRRDTRDRDRDRDRLTD